MIKEIAERRSIRSFKPDPVPQELIAELLHAGMLAPSSKNRQPWHFIVTAGDAKEDLLNAMAEGLKREKAVPFLPQSARYLAGAEHSLAIMREAPAVIWVTDPTGRDLTAPLTPEERVYEICNAQSVGAALENMSLAATHLGLGSLWICDIYFAHRELTERLNSPGTICAALALGYPDEAPFPRPRKEMDEVVEWRM